MGPMRSSAISCSSCWDINRGTSSSFNPSWECSPAFSRFSSSTSSHTTGVSAPPRCSSFQSGCEDCSMSTSCWRRPSRFPRSPFLLDMRSGLPETYAAPLLPVERCHRRSRLRRDANQSHANDPAWGTPGPICAPVVRSIAERMQSNWQVSDRQLGELSREAILAHPMEVAYRFLWNLGDFLFVRRTVFRTEDLDPLLFESNRIRSSRIFHLRDGVQSQRGDRGPAHPRPRLGGPGRPDAL